MRGLKRDRGSWLVVACKMMVQNARDSDLTYSWRRRGRMRLPTASTYCAGECEMARVLPPRSDPLLAVARELVAPAEVVAALRFFAAGRDAGCLRNHIFIQIFSVRRPLWGIATGYRKRPQWAMVGGLIVTVSAPGHSSGDDTSV